LKIQIKSFQRVQIEQKYKNNLIFFGNLCKIGISIIELKVKFVFPYMGYTFILLISLSISQAAAGIADECA
jgi:hypothetical protein